MLTHADLLKVLSYDPDTGQFTWETPTARCIKPGMRAGYETGKGYVSLRLFGRDYRAHNLAWFYVTGEWPVEELDHINGKPGDNRIANLRQCRRKDNCRNITTPSHNTSGATGVSWNKRLEKWCAYIATDGVLKHLGCFSDKDLAIEVRRDAALRMHGEFAGELRK